MFIYSGRGILCVCIKERMCMPVLTGHTGETVELRGLMGELEGLSRLGLFGGTCRGWKDFTDVRWVTMKKIRETCTILNGEQKTGCVSKFDDNTTALFEEFVDISFETYDPLCTRDYVLKFFTTWTRVKPGLYFYLYNFQHDRLDSVKSKLYVRDLKNLMDRFHEKLRKKLGKLLPE